MHEVKHTAAFHASPSHHDSKLNFLLRASLVNVLRSILYYSLVARLSAAVRLQGKAEESWIFEQNHPFLFDFKGCHLRRLLRDHWRITKFFNKSIMQVLYAFCCIFVSLIRVMPAFRSELGRRKGNFAGLRTIN